MNRMLIGLVATASLLSGCTTIGFKKGHLARAEPLFASGKDDKGYDECLNDPTNLLAIASEGKLDPTSLPTDKRCSALIEKLHSFNFGEAIPEKQTGKLATIKYRRDNVIDALVAVSDKKCSDYQAYLKTFDGQTNSFLSILAIATGGAGSTVTGEQAARILAGTSGVASGTRAALNDSWFSNQTIPVLVAAFGKARDAQRRDIMNRKMCSITNYTVMQGIADAMRYHASCSLITGLSEAAKAVERSDQPGLDVMRRQLADLGSIREQASRLISASFSSNSVEALIALGQSETENRNLKDMISAKGDLTVQAEELQAAKEKEQSKGPGADATKIANIDAELGKIQDRIGKSDTAIEKQDAVAKAATAKLTDLLRRNPADAGAALSAAGLTGRDAERPLCPYEAPVDIAVAKAAAVSTPAPAPAAAPKKSAKKKKRV